MLKDFKLDGNLNIMSNFTGCCFKVYKYLTVTYFNLFLTYVTV